jgi:hypothetical protein
VASSALSMMNDFSVRKYFDSMDFLTAVKLVYIHFHPKTTISIYSGHECVAH